MHHWIRPPSIGPDRSAYKPGKPSVSIALRVLRIQAFSTDARSGLSSLASRIDTDTF